MKLKRIISIVLAFMLLFSMSIDTLAAVLNINTDGENTIQVETGTDQFFNVTFAPKEWTPNAEQVYVMHMGLSYDMWRHFGNMNI